MIVIRDLYGLKSIGAAWRAMISETILDLGYKPSIEDMDIWMKPDTKPQSGKYYYAYVFVYADNLLYINNDPEIFIRYLKCLYRLTGDSLGSQTLYLGANVEKLQLEGYSIY